MGKCGCCTAKCQAITGLCSAPLNLFVVIWASMEKARWTPVAVPMQCENAPLPATRLSAISMPSPLAEAMGMQPGALPNGLYLNVSSSTSCSNPGQADITIVASGFETTLLAPNLTDLAAGGLGKPYGITGKIRLSQDLVLPSTGQANMVTVTEVAQTVDEVLAGMSPSSIQQGYSVGFSRSVQVVKTCSSVLGLSSCIDSTIELFCGSYAGSCLAEVLDASGSAVVPAQFEPAICAYTGQLCGQEAEVHAQLDATALGIQVLNQVPCAASTGLPNTTLCNVVSAPGVDSTTFLAKTIEPPMVFTTEEQARQAEMAAAAEAAINWLILPALILNSFFFFSNLFSGLFNLRKHLRMKVQAAEEPPKWAHAAPTPPTLATVMAAGVIDDKP